VKVKEVVSMQCMRGYTRRLSLLQLGHQFGQGNLLRLVVNSASDEEKGIEWMILTVEEGIEVVIVNFAEFEKVLAECGASLYFKVDNDVSQRCLEEHRHA
jgi:hypothetical protein